MNVESLLDEPHREVLGMLPEGLYDLSDLEAGVASLMGLLASMPFTIPEGVNVADHSVPVDGAEIAVRVYKRDGLVEPAPVMFWIHGGGLVLGNLEMDDDISVQAAIELGIVIVSVDYRFAPEFAYPIPINDCEAALHWVIDNASDLGIDPDQLVLAGASAGGGIGASLAMRLRGGSINPKLLLLRYPMLDDRNITASSHAITDSRVWNRAANIAGWSAYLGDSAGGEGVPADAAPARATDLTGLAPTIITVGSVDLFVDENMAFAQSLIAAGVSTEFHLYPGAFHGGDKMVPHAHATQAMRRDEFAAIQRALSIAEGTS